MLQLQLIKKILGINLLLLSFGSFVYADSIIGDITEHKGSGGLTRQSGESLTTAVDVDIESLDHIETANGRMKIKFVDDTNLSLTEHTEVTIDEYYFDPNPSKSKMTMRFVSGTARFSTGKLGLVPRENIVIQTPTATIGVRGTDFTTTVDELGRSLVLLLPDGKCEFPILGECKPSGEITVTNEGGTVSLTEAYQATMVASIATPPIQPIVMDNINVSMINNMFIVSPPQKIVDAQEEQSDSGDSSQVSLLDFTDLDFDALEEDWEGEDDLEFTELDIDLLDVDFLQDVLVTLEAIDVLSRSRGGGGGDQGDIVGTTVGFDKETQYNTIIDQGAGEIWFYREVNGVISIRIPITTQLTLDSENEGKKNTIIVGDGQSVLITIRQSG